MRARRQGLHGFGGSIMASSRSGMLSRHGGDKDTDRIEEEEGADETAHSSGDMQRV